MDMYSIAQSSRQSPYNHALLGPFPFPPPLVSFRHTRSLRTRVHELRTSNLAPARISYVSKYADDRHKLLRVYVAFLSITPRSIFASTTPR